MTSPKKKNKDSQSTATTIDVQAAFEFLLKYHPALWDRMDKDDMIHVITLSHLLFKTRPDLLEATTNSRLPPTQ